MAIEEFSILIIGPLPAEPSGENLQQIHEDIFYPEAEEQEDIISRLLEYTRHDGNFTEEYILARDDEQAPDYGERAINLALENEVADTEVNRYAEYLRTLELGTDEYIRARDNLLFALYFSGRITSDVLLAQHSNPEAARDYCGI